MHKHHKIIFKDGKRIRTDEVVTISVEEHAKEHKRLYEEGGHWQDKLAYEGLMGLKKRPDIMKEIHSKRSPESYATYGMLGKKQSENQKQSVSKANKKVWASYSDSERKKRSNKVFGKKNGKSKSVIIDNKKYDTIIDAMKKTGLSYYYIMKEVKKNVRFPMGGKV